MEKSGLYKTIIGESRGMYKEKGSKFIGIAVPCTNPDQAKEYIDIWKKEHHQARHVCYAYIFGLDKANYRANDDGEPNNSAGQPILGQIRAFELTNVLVGVVRYYGGTKLGVGGLMNAYKTAASEALECGGIIEKEVFLNIRVTFTYDSMSILMVFVKRNNLEVYDQQFESECKFTLAVPLEREAIVMKELEEFQHIELKKLGVY